MPNRKEIDDYAVTAVLSKDVIAQLAAGHRDDALVQAAAEAHGRYQEYLRALDELPVLRDVVREPPRAVGKDFRLGKRPDVRKQAREDACLLREQHAGDVEQQYKEYAAALAKPIGAKRAGARKAAKTTGGSKKRAKRSKRSARPKT